MANERPTQFTAVTGANLASGDLIVGVDVSDITDNAAGSDMIITVAELIAGLRLLGLTQGREIPWHADGGANLTLTNATQAARWAGNQPTRMIKLLPDMNRFTQVRMVGNQVTTSASPNTPIVRMVYKTGAYSTTVGDYAELAASGTCEVSLNGTGVRDTGWISLPAGATGDCFVGLLEQGGDGAADPAFGHLMLYLR